MKFIHLRYHDIGDNLEEVILPNGGVTIAFEYDEKSGMVSFSTAQCRTTDNFCRKIGRDIAMGRYMAGKVYTCQVGKYAEIAPAIIHEVYRHYKENGDLNVDTWLY